MRRYLGGLLAAMTLAAAASSLPGLACQDLPVEAISTTAVSGPDTSPTSGTSSSTNAAAGTDSTTATGGEPAESVGLAGLGDSYYPSAGNGGYDVTEYRIALTFDPGTGGLSGTTVMAAEAVQDLSAFNLDFWGMEGGGVGVDGMPAEYRRDGQELTIECPDIVKEGETFSTEIRYSGTPAPVEDAEGESLGWQQEGDNVFTVDEPVGAANWFPVNDHPTDKATYVFRVTVPKPYVAVANGVLVSTEDLGDSRTFIWEMRRPCASYLAAMAIGEFTLEESAAPNGVPIRNYFAASLADDGHALFAHTGEMLAFFADRFGPYPFEEYGVVVPNAETGTAMENQTMSLFGRDMLETGMAEPSFEYAYISHELAHQWFGDSVTPVRWQDIWLNEGFATYASWLWVEHDLGAQEMSGWVEWAIQEVRNMERSSNKEPPPGDPGTADLFGVNVYERAALTLHALRLTLGDDVFFRILREWVSRYQYGNAGTEDFIALVQEEAGGTTGRDLTGFFDAWLRDETMPELP